MKKWTIGVLIPLLDGFYFGDIIWGISRGAKLHHANVLAITTSMYNSLGERIRYDSEVAWDRVDAWIIIGDAVTRDYGRKLVQTGKPVISIGNYYDNMNVYVVQCDNVKSTLEATKHLIELGHREIAFVGGIDGNTDFVERLEGYKHALEESGIPYDHKLIYNIKSGEKAAYKMIDDGLNFSAIVAGADHVAAEVIQVFNERGIRIPEDVAIVGFDDSSLANKCKPALSTVRQPIIDLGLAALNRAIEVLTDKPRTPDITQLPARLIIRDSCGGKPRDHSLNEQILTWKNIEENELENLIESHHQVGLSVINSPDLSWLRWTNQHWGCLALWNKDNSNIDKELIVDRTFSSKGDALPEIGETYSMHTFPPQSMPLESDDMKMEIAVIQPVFSDSRLWGFITTVGAVNVRLLRGYDTRQLSSMVGVMIEHQVLLTQYHNREASNKALVEKLEIVSRTTNDGVYDCNLVTNQIEWISGVEHIFGIKMEEIPNSTTGMMDYIHPKDIEMIQQAWRDHMSQRKPFEVEFRVRKRDEYVWVSSAGEAILDHENNPIHFIGSLTNIHVRKLAEEEIHHLAYHDPLTGLANRRNFYEKLTQDIAAAQMNHSKIAVLVIDLDHFKLVNDTYGHDIGDRLLQYVAKLLREQMGKQGTVARVGGDEFMVAIPNTQDENEVRRLVDLFLSKLEKPLQVEGHEIHAMVSIGLSWYPDQGTDINKLIKVADSAMYKAKQRGRN